MNKIALITGGNSGLGLATAKEFCAHGISTIITGRNEDKLKYAVEVCGPNCHSYVLDMTNFDLFPNFVEEITETFGHIDILVNNAGINQKKPLVEVSDQDFQDILNTNVVGLFSLSREVIKQMIKQQSGVIVNISSMTACYGIPYVIAYSASKSAVSGMTQAMAVELAQYGIRVNAVAPGFIYSEMTAKALDKDPERKQKVFSRTPMGKMGSPEDIAQAVYFLASDQSQFITGEILRVDGGNAIGF